MTKPSNQQIRKFIAQHFNDQELDIFCFDHFPDLEAKFTPNMSREQKAIELIRYCDRQYQSREPLLSKLEKEREVLYRKAFETQQRSENYEQDFENLKSKIEEEEAIAPPPSESRAQQQELPKSDTVVTESPDPPITEPEHKPVVKTPPQTNVEEGTKSSKPKPEKPIPDIKESQSKNKRQQQEAQVTPLYNQLIQAQKENEWLKVLTLAAQIDILLPDYQDVADLRSVAMQQLQKPAQTPDTIVTEVPDSTINEPEDKPIAKTPPHTKVEEDTKSPKPEPVKEAKLDKETVVHGRTGLEFVRIPAGTFIFGEEGSEEEKHLPDYWISKTPITNKVYQKFIDANPRHNVPKIFMGGDNNWDKKKRTFNPELAEHPVAITSWEDAVIFCMWAGLQLPTEEQWEKAARGTDGRAYPWGNNDPTDQLCNFSKIGTTPVDNYSPLGDSPYGCMDMSGNVQEWCLDKTGNQGDTTIDDSGDHRGLRGGSYLNNQDDAHITRKSYKVPNYGEEGMGFRVVLHHLSPIIEDDKFIDEQIGLEFVRVPAGKFTFGEEEDEQEKNLPEYWISTTPVTNLVYQQFIDANPEYKIPKMFLGGVFNWDKKQRTFNSELPWHPVAIISWDDAIAFCEWAGLQLPTEGQWEKAARGTDGRIYPWGNNDPTDQLCSISGNGLMPAGYYSPLGDSPYGCVDMSGNVREWCLDKIGDQGDTTIDDSGDQRAMRGGSYLDDQEKARVTYRSYYDPSYGNMDMGFRVIVKHPPSYVR